MSELEQRVQSFARNVELERLLSEVNGLLGPANDALMAGVTEREAKIFIVGPLRSGTTVFTQWLAATGLVGYPSNLLSRFYAAPLIGAKIQQILTDPQYNFRNELQDLRGNIGFQSQNGKTTGALAPNEFWYFWRRFLPFDELDYAPSDVLRAHTPMKDLVRQLNGLANLFEKPFMLKAMILSQNVDVLTELFERSVIVWVQRDPVFNIQSALEARHRQYGCFDAWYSFKIREYPRLRELDPLRSVAGQVYAVNRSIENAFARLPSDRTLHVRYEDFCASPRSVYEGLATRLAAMGSWEGPQKYPQGAVSNFDHTNKWRLTEYSEADAREAYAAMREWLEAEIVP